MIAQTGILETVLTHVPELIFVVDRDLNYVYANPEGAKVVGAKPADLHGKPLARFLPSDRIEKSRELIAQLQESRSTVSRETTYPGPNGMHHFEYRHTPVFDDTGQVSMVISIGRDITLHKQAEERAWKLQEFALLLTRAATESEIAEAVINTVHEHLAVSCTVVHFVTKNGSFRLVASRGISEERLQRLRQVDPRGDSLPNERAIRTQVPVWLETRDELLREFPEMSYSTTSPDLLMALASVPLAVKGVKLGAISFSFPRIMAFDEGLKRFILAIAAQCAQALDRARLYEDERRARERLEIQAAETLRALEVRDEFLSIASHELKTPLTSLILQNDLLKRQGAKKIACFLDQSNQQLDRLNRLVEDMLDITRIRSGKLTLELERFDLCGLIKEVLFRLSESLARAECEIQANLSGPLHGNWDRGRVDQILTNLMTNAAKYGAGRPIEVSAERAGTSARITVRDGGRGISPGDHDRIFRQFERAVSSSEVSGLGIGLHLVRQFVEMHGGTVSVESDLGQGAKFVVELPLED